MLNNYLRIAGRNLWKHRFYTGVNIFGLSLGIGGGLVLFLFITYHLSYDRYHRNEGELYRVVTDLHLPDGTIEYSAGSPLALTAVLEQELSQVKDQAVLLKAPGFTVSVLSPGKKQLFTEHDNIAFTDHHWFNLFSYKWMSGNAATALEEPNTAVITHRLAQKYFGSTDVIGRLIRLDDKHTLSITGVLQDYPANTDIKTDLFISRASFKVFYPGQENQMNASWGFINSTTNSYVWLPDNVTDRVTTALSGLPRKYFPADVAPVYRFRLQPLKDVHFDGRYGGVIQRSMLVTLGLTGLFLIIIACFNFINLATAQSTKRAREIGTRKVLGSTAAGIFRQFIAETAAITLLAALLSFAWVMLFLPVLNRWLNVQLVFNPFANPGLLLCIVLLICIIIVTAGFYPAMVLSRWRPVDALKKQYNDHNTVLFRKGLIIFQNVVVQVLIICTLIITLQIRHMKSADPGFNKDAVMMVPLPADQHRKFAYLEQQLRNTQQVDALSLCFRAPLSDKSLGGSVAYDDRPWEDFTVRTLLGDDQYLHLFGLQLLAGRNLQPSDSVREFLVNETFMHKLGIRDPQQVIGRRLVAGGMDDAPGTIAGVVKDFNVQALYAPIEPVLITTKQDRYQYAAIRLAKGDQARARQAVQKAWEAVFPGNVFEYHYLDKQIDEYYHKEELLNKLINVTAALAIIISCLGLLGLFSFFAIQRTREIGIRKVLGANMAAIVYLLSKDFLKLVLLSVIVAAPLAWYFMNGWLQHFAYRINISWWIFIAAGLLSVLIALATVGYQAIRAALANPVKSLRTE